ncbi:MAG: SPOR domain-containing protein [Spirochaetaceae bacterium]|jgi:DedD protein|nr:SPOR domain-containing protein [Spirochaetaceae bacterium]
MDKKKLLLVAASVGMFLVLVLGGAILVFTPRGRAYETINVPATTTVVKETAKGAAVTLTDNAIPPGYVPPVPVPVQPAETGMYPPIPTNGALPITGLPGAVQPGTVPDTGVPAARDGRSVISVPVPENAGVPAAYSDKADSPRGPPQVKPAAARTAQPVAETAKPAAAVARGQPAKSAAKGAYWVQTGSYAQKSYADNAKDYLSTKGISSIVLNSSIGGKIYYRVRVGPYISQNEADYWLSLIKSIDGMENSQIWKNGS